MKKRVQHREGIWPRTYKWLLAAKSRTRVAYSRALLCSPGFPASASPLGAKSLKVREAAPSGGHRRSQNESTRSLFCSRGLSLAKKLGDKNHNARRASEVKSGPGRSQARCLCDPGLRGPARGPREGEPRSPVPHPHGPHRPSTPTRPSRTGRRSASAAEADPASPRVDRCARVSAPSVSPQDLRSLLRGLRSPDVEPPSPGTSGRNRKRLVRCAVVRAASGL